MRDDVKTYTDHGYRYPTMVRHDGKVIALAMDEHRRIRYTVLDLASATASNPFDAAGWSANPTESDVRRRDRPRRVRGRRSDEVARRQARHHVAGRGRRRRARRRDRPCSCRPRHA